MKESYDKIKKRRGSLFNNFSFKLDLKKIGWKVLMILLLISVLLGVIYFLINYKADRYKIDNLKYANSLAISQILNEELSSETFLNLNTNNIEKRIKASSKYIKEVKVSKSLVNGIIVDIVEYEPQIILKTIDNRRYFMTKDEEAIEIDSESEILIGVPELNYTGTNIDDLNLSRYALSAKALVEKLEYRVNGSFNFDNFGNLFILLEGNRIIRFDLNERFFTLDEQIKLMHDAMAKNPSFNEINIQFSYLVIK